ncbi:ABC transporter ATP-binding protein [Phaeobacter inhibens]|nr:ABC transporter ATP-binding protein [Phaeobacter inhibens]
MPGLDVRGNITLDGQKQLLPLWKDHIFVLPQEPAVALDPTMPVGKQLAEIFQWRRDPKCTWATPLALASQVGLNKEDLAKHPQQLSGGMQQRVMIAMALAARASFVVADEPTKGLDTENKARMIDLFKMIQSTGRGLIVITHDLDVAGTLAGEVVVFDQGKVVEQGAADQVLNTPQSDATKTLIRSLPANWRDHPSLKAKASETILTLENVAFGFTHTAPIITEASLDIRSGEIVGLYGPSGVGKSTLADLCLGLHKPTSGLVNWLGETVTQAVVRRCRPQFQKLFQNPVTSFPPNLILGDVFDKLTPMSGGGSFSRSNLMDRLNIDEALLRRRPDQVSGGELQRLAIVRVMLGHPKFLVCDEPSSRLDMSIQRLAIDVITDYAAETNAAVLLISHDRGVLQKRANRVFELNASGVLSRLSLDDVTTTTYT